MEDRPQTLGEEIANAVSHGVAFVTAAVAVPFLIAAVARNSTAQHVAAVCIFSATIVILYLASTLYHALPGYRTKAVFKRLDHSAIYLLIAGTYTPFTLGILGGTWGWSLFGIVWGLAVIGVTLKVTNKLSYPQISLGLYLVMGWLIIVAIGPLWNKMSGAGLAWLIAGGAAYTGGVAFFVLDNRWKYAHFIWHLWVVAGTACHFFAVLWHSA
jgi:hemolysin III